MDTIARILAYFVIAGFVVLFAPMLVWEWYMDGR
jgi:hypothetical protein